MLNKIKWELIYTTLARAPAPFRPLRISYHRPAVRG